MPSATKSTPQSLHSVQAESFFEDIVEAFGPPSRNPFPTIVVAHILGSGYPFFDVLHRLFGKYVLIPKASTDHSVRDVLVDQGMCSWDKQNTDDLASETFVRTVLKDHPPKQGVPVLVFDVGGKLTQNYGLLKSLLRDLSVIVVEDTENGHQKYQEFIDHLKQESPELVERILIWSVARSILKEPEDYWTGRGLVEATETILRVSHGLMADREATVFGYGKIGRSAAHACREKRLLVHIVELNPLRAVLAQCHGFKLSTMKEAQKRGGYFFFATGNGKGSRGIKLSDLLAVKKDVTVTLATSIDDEIGGYEELEDPKRATLNVAFPVSPVEAYRGATHVGGGLL